jgi:hypothetical protein
MLNLDLITRVGPFNSRATKAPAISVPFRIEVEMGGGPAVLSLSPAAAADLRTELDLYLQKNAGPQ